jgi:two-component system CheB/CheR fusion protein
VNSTPNGELNALLDYLKNNRGFDFTGYKRPNLARRIGVRIQTLRLVDYAAYQDYLEVHPEEFTSLFNTILINVTSFFRDKAAWDHLAAQFLPQVTAPKRKTQPIRVWSAGCASGEEAYTLAMLLAEALGHEPFLRRVKIYATDVDEDALNAARTAVYPKKAMEAVPEELRGKYFQRTEGGFVFNDDLRRALIFGRHDLIQDAPISRLDLLICRNTLMYFNAETQGRIISRFHFGLKDSGLLFLGRAEMLLSHGDLFVPVDLGHRIFTKAPGSAGRAQKTADLRNEHWAAERNEAISGLCGAAFEAGPLAQIAVDDEGLLILANRAARTLFGLKETDLGRPLQDLELSYRPAELRSQVDRAYARRLPVSLSGIERPLLNGSTQFLDIHIIPLLEAGAAIGAGITFADVTHTRTLVQEVQQGKREIEAAYEQLQSSNEELETTNEELQSTNEELETTNEELQSTNEEMETMNEELQSSNEELRSINDQLEDRTGELDTANDFLGSILSSLRAGVVVLDKGLRVLEWSRGAEGLWGLRATEVRSQPFVGLDFGLPAEKLPLAAVLSGKSAAAVADLEAVNRRGQKFLCHVTCSALLGPQGEKQGVVLLMEEIEK